MRMRESEVMRTLQIHLDQIEVGHIRATDESGNAVKVGYRIESDPANERFLVQVDFGVSFKTAAMANKIN